MGQISRASLLWRTEKWEPVDPVTRESMLKDFGVPGYSPHSLTIRAAPTPVTGLNQTDKVTASNTTTVNNIPSTPTKSHNSLVPHWSYEKNSVAVAIAISVVTAIGFTTLVILFVQKVRRSWKRHKREKEDFAVSRYRSYYMSDSAENGGLERKFSRESVMFSKDDTSHQEYLVEQEGDKITRVFRAGKNDSACTFDSVGKPREQRQQQQQQQSPAPSPSTPSALPALPAPSTPSTPQEAAVDTTETVDPVKPESEVQPDTPLTVRGRSGSIPKPIVIVPPPLKQVSSLKATPVTQPPDRLPERPSFIPKSRSEARRSLIKLATDPGSLFRLPSIKKTTSPIYRP